MLHQGGWGVGKVRTVHAERSMLVVDFQTKPGHEIGLSMAKKALRKLEPDHVAVLRWTDPERLSTMAKADPVGLLKLAVISLGGTALLREVRANLSGAAMPEGEWSRWWAKARKAAGNDPLLEIAGAPKTTLRVLEEPRDEQAEVQEKFARSFTLSERVDLARHYMRGTQDGRRVGGRKAARLVSGQPLPPALTGMITAISEELGAPPEDIAEDSVRPGRRDHLARRLEAVLIVREAARRFADCDELVMASTAHPAIDELPAPEILAGRLRIISDSPTRVETLYAMEEAFGEAAADNIVLLLKTPGLWDLFEAGAARLTELGYPDHFKALARDLLVAPRDHPDSFAALARAHLSGKLEELCPNIGDPIDFALKTLNVLDYLGRELQMVVSDTRKLELKTSLNHLRTTLLERGALALKRVAVDGTTEDVDQAFRLIRRTSGLTDNQKYQLEKPLIKAHPDVVKRNEPAAAAATTVSRPKVIYSTDSGLRRREAELRHLTEVEIPANARDIGRAAAMGDLSENAEWTAAIERQGFLTKRAEELEGELKRVQVLDPANTDLSRASFGVRVTLQNLDDQSEERYAILGPWDKDIKYEVISHMATLAEAIQGHAIGEQVEVELPDCTKRFKIKAIEVAQPMAFVEPKRQPSNSGDN